MEKLLKELIKQNSALMEAPKGESNISKITGAHFEKFEEANEWFESFLDRFVFFIDIQIESEEKWAKAFIYSMSAKLHNLLKNLLAPENPFDKDFGTLKKILKDQLNPKAVTNTK